MIAFACNNCQHDSSPTPDTQGRPLIDCVPLASVPAHAYSTSPSRPPSAGTLASTCPPLTTRPSSPTKPSRIEIGSLRSAKPRGQGSEAAIGPRVPCGTQFSAVSGDIRAFAACTMPNQATSTRVPFEKESIPPTERLHGVVHDCACQTSRGIQASCSSIGATRSWKSRPPQPYPRAQMRKAALTHNRVFVKFISQHKNVYWAVLSLIKTQTQPLPTFPRYARIHTQADIHGDSMVLSAPPLFSSTWL